ncbi:MAG: M13 family metallopeptidase [Ginsengibacter sp.]
MRLKYLTPLLILNLVLFSTIVFSQTAAKHSPLIKKNYIDKSNMDLSVKPGDNFFQYANGNWIKNNPVPASRTRWGSFDELRLENSKRLSSLLDDASHATNPDRTTQIIGDFYYSGMDSNTIEQKGATPIKPILNEIEEAKNVSDILHEIATMRINGYGSAGFRISVSADRKNVTQYVASIGQGGTNLPDRDYYLKDDARSVKIRDAYKENIQTLFTLLGDDAAAAKAKSDVVMKMETTLAKAQYARVAMRDPYKTYNKYSVKDLSTITPGINWSDLLKDMKIMGADSVVVNNPGFFKTFDSMLVAAPVNDWKTYLSWEVIHSAAPNLSSPFVQAAFDLNKVLTGQKEQTPRWQRMSGLIDGTLGDMIGQLYVDKYFKPEAKQYMVDLVNNMQNTFGNRIKNLDWMSDETKKKALEKLDAFTKKIAYPDKWKDYDGVIINKNDYMSNLHSVSVWAYNYMVNHMGQPVDRTQWGMTPPTINAQYSPTDNDITFPAGILQSPFFDFAADDAINYGGIAAVIGHEMTHGFDDQGRQYDANGNLKDWWQKTDEKNFKERVDKVANEYDAFTVLDTIHLNGKLTLGENLADLGGLNIAYEAFTKTKEFKEGTKIDGFTPQQRFFLSWAQVWRNNTLPETVAQLVKTDPHSPGMYRTNAPVSNMDAWYSAFNIKKGDAMFVPKDERIHIW